jgi:hypothetical protein
MHRRLLAFFAATTILLMVLPPVCNLFDKWDKGPELPLTGHDTETTLMAMAFEAGMGMAVAWSSVLLLAWLSRVFLPGAIESALVPVVWGGRATEYLLLLFSPPWRILPLRI